jgi:hypothetical protein
VFGRKPKLKEGMHVFSTKKNGDKISQGKAGERSKEILQRPTPDNVVLALVYRVEHENYAEILDLDQDRCDLIPPKVYSMLDGWIRESIPELVNNVLSLPDGAERDQAKRVLRQKMDSLVDKKLKRTLYSICRSLKILN